MKCKTINIKLEEGLYTVINFEKIEFSISKNTIFPSQNICGVYKFFK